MAFLNSSIYWKIRKTFIALYKNTFLQQGKYLINFIFLIVNFELRISPKNSIFLKNIDSNFKVAEEQCSDTFSFHSSADYVEIILEKVHFKL